MKTKNLCPHCRSVINVNEKLVLVAKRKACTKGIILLHTELGNYENEKNPDFAIKDYEEVDFFCPICSESLEYKFKMSLVSVLMVDEFEKESIVVFSKIYQKKCTYHIIDNKIESYGSCAKKFSNPKWFLLSVCFSFFKM